jgi:uncharacterized membrane protein AbrB (regulator of aidB expression)
MGERWSRRLLDGVLVVAGAVVAALLFGLIGLPSPALFGGLLAGLVRALAVPARIAVPARATTAAQAGIGVAPTGCRSSS